MSYFPRFIDPVEKELDLVELMQSRYWHKIKFNDISPDDRVLTIRTTNGTRLLIESVVREFDYTKGAWLNSLGTPVVSVLDTQIFKAGELREDQSEADPDQMLGS